VSFTTERAEAAAGTADSMADSLAGTAGQEAIDPAPEAAPAAAEMTVTPGLAPEPEPVPAPSVDLVPPRSTPEAVFVAIGAEPELPSADANATETWSNEGGSYAGDPESYGAMPLTSDLEGGSEMEASPTERAARAEAAAADAPRTVGRAIADQLAAAGTRLAFTVPGESFLGLLDGFAAAGIRVVATRHEGAASFMAAAASQLSGKPQVVMATRAVGAANTAIGIHAARADSAPLFALFGQVRRVNRGRESFQEVELSESFGSLALWSTEARDEADAMRAVGEGLKRQARGRPGPIVISIPEDVLESQAPAGAPFGAAPSSGGPAADRDEVRQILKWLAAAERPVILAGGGVLRARSSKRLMLLADAMQVPVIASWRRPDVVPNDHPLYLGMTGYWSAPTVRRRLEEADMVLVLGARLNEVASFGYAIPRADTRWAHVDLEPRAHVAGLPQPTLSVVADAARFLDACWSDLRGAALDNEMRERRKAFNAADREAYLAASHVAESPGQGSGVHPGRVIATLQEVLPAESLLTTDAGNFGGWLARGFRFLRPGTFVGTTAGAMGFALPAAIAGSLLRPDRPSIALAGDGGFAMSMAELETAVRERARVIAIVFDNEEFGTIRMHQEHAGLAPVGTTTGPIDFADVARATGALGFTVSEDAEFEPALREALAARQPSVIHLHVDRAWVSVDEGPTSG